ncbi:MAG: hypothetical protein ABF629_08315 [Sporolactobacillus sp.]|uniref:hypothetical protein n=1 Tax=Sporolactobacillus sp. STSJ-5 TaxID=2965076 RepID=UPI0021041816|nr:hypothetical protein [Sporolactobacillus sp. STSJ-5]MCQ2008412.1 hypothetical protein [Sporolactobacillus sp. STSJ-5]
MAKRNVIIETILWAFTALFLMKRRQILFEFALLAAGHLLFFKHIQKQHESE